MYCCHANTNRSPRASSACQLITSFTPRRLLPLRIFLPSRAARRRGDSSSSSRLPPPNACCRAFHQRDLPVNNDDFVRTPVTLGRTFLRRPANLNRENGAPSTISTHNLLTASRPLPCAASSDGGRASCRSGQTHMCAPMCRGVLKEAPSALWDADNVDDKTFGKAEWAVISGSRITFCGCLKSR